MVVGKDRLYHCHKIHKHVTIFEDYEMDEEPPRLVQCSCPYHKYTDMKPHCDGYNEFGFQCCYAKADYQTHKFLWPL